MDKNFDRKLLHGSEAKAEVGFDTKNDPLLIDLFESACFLEPGLIESMEPDAKRELLHLERQKAQVLNAAARRMEEGELGRIEAKEKVEHTLRMRADGDIRVENNDGTEKVISPGMAIEAARWMRFNNIDFSLGKHDIELLRRIVHGNAISDIEHIRDQEIAIVMMQQGAPSLARTFEHKYDSITHSLADKKGGEIAEELVASFMRVLSEDGLVPFDFQHADVLDDVMYDIDFICKVPYKHIPPAHQKQGRSEFVDAIQFTVQQSQRELQHKSFAVHRIMTTSRNAERPEGEQIDRAELINLHLPQKEGDYVRKWQRGLPSNFRGPEMALDAPAREIIFRKITDRVCWFWTTGQKDAALAKMKARYSKMYTS